MGKGKRKRKRERKAPQAPEPNVPAQQANPSAERPNVPAQQTNRSVGRPTAWTTKVRIFLTTPSWQGFGTWLGVALAVASFAVAYYMSQRKEREAAEQRVSQINYAWFIKPAPTPEEQFKKNGTLGSIGCGGYP